MIKNLAAIDLGTNSFHLLIVQPEKNGCKFRVLDHVKETIRLGSGSTDMKHLSEQAIARAIEALKRFKQIADSYGAQVRAIGTSALREALNQNQFITQVKAETGIIIEVVSGFEEARLIYLGVLQALPLFNRQSLLFDIGGGSTEFLIGLRRRVLYGNSLKLGAIRLTQRFFPDGKFRPSEIKDCREYVSGMLSPIVREVRRLGYEIAVGSSGTLLSVARVACGKRKKPNGGAQLNGMVITRELMFEALEEIISTRTVKNIAAIPGIDADRADIIVGGAIILEQIFKRLRIKQLTLSEASLQEGIAFDTLEKKQKRSSHHYLSDLRRSSVLALADNFSFEKQHSLHVSCLVLRLFDETAGLHKLLPIHRELLEYSALLHDIGLFVSHSQHHRHTFYLIRNSELLGFTENEKAIMANVARYHRKSHPKLKHEGFAELSPEDRDAVIRLASLLRIADGLDRSHTSAVRDLSVEKKGSRLVFILNPRRHASASLEIWGAERKKQLFEETFKVKVSFTLAGI
jgi:exopolyphosphatase/guanosine-5'-triphosphate,3'-diphosphate pyrophosphatase